MCSAPAQTSQAFNGAGVSAVQFQRLLEILCRLLFVAVCQISVTQTVIRGSLVRVRIHIEFKKFQRFFDFAVLQQSITDQVQLTWTKLESIWLRLFCFLVLLHGGIESLFLYRFIDERANRLLALGRRKPPEIEVRNFGGDSQIYVYGIRNAFIPEAWAEHPEVLPVQLEVTVKGDAGVFPGIIHFVLAPDQRSLDFLAHIPDGKKTGHYVIIALFANGCALKANRGKFVGIEKWGGFQVFVAKGAAGINACGFDDCSHRRFCEISFVVHDGAAKV